MPVKDFTSSQDHVFAELHRLSKFFESLISCVLNFEELFGRIIFLLLVCQLILSLYRFQGFLVGREIMGLALINMGSINKVDSSTGLQKRNHVDSQKPNNYQADVLLVFWPAHCMI